MGIKYKIDYNFFKKWTPKMAYVIGFIFADGSLEDAPYIRGKYIRIANTDLFIIQKIKKVIKSGHTIVRRQYDHPNRKDLFLLRIGSHKIYNDLLKFGLCPRKSLIIKFPKMPKKYFLYFLRGYFDGDGSIMSRGKYGVKIAFTSGSLDFLKSLAIILSDNLNVKLQRVYNSHRSYQLCYRTYESLDILKFIYKDKLNGLYLKKKYRIYINLLSRRKRLKIR